MPVMFDEGRRQQEVKQQRGRRTQRGRLRRAGGSSLPEELVGSHLLCLAAVEQQILHRLGHKLAF